MASSTRPGTRPGTRPSNKRKAGEKLTEDNTPDDRLDGAPQRTKNLRGRPQVAADRGNRRAGAERLTKVVHNLNIVHDQYADYGQQALVPQQDVPSSQQQGSLALKDSIGTTTIEHTTKDNTRRNIHSHDDDDHHTPVPDVPSASPTWTAINRVRPQLGAAVAARAVRQVEGTILQAKFDELEMQKKKAAKGVAKEARAEMNRQRGQQNASVAHPLGQVQVSSGNGPAPDMTQAAVISTVATPTASANKPTIRQPGRDGTTRAMHEAICNGQKSRAQKERSGANEEDLASFVMADIHEDILEGTVFIRNDNVTFITEGRLPTWNQLHEQSKVCVLDEGRLGADGYGEGIVVDANGFIVGTFRDVRMKNSVFKKGTTQRQVALHDGLEQISGEPVSWKKWSELGETFDHKKAAKNSKADTRAALEFLGMKRGQHPGLESILNSAIEAKKELLAAKRTQAGTANPTDEATAPPRQLRSRKALHSEAEKTLNETVDLANGRPNKVSKAARAPKGTAAPKTAAHPTDGAQVTSQRGAQHSNPIIIAEQEAPIAHTEQQDSQDIDAAVQQDGAHDPEPARKDEANATNFAQNALSEHRIHNDGTGNGMNGAVGGHFDASSNNNDGDYDAEVVEPKKKAGAKGKAPASAQPNKAKNYDWIILETDEFDDEGKPLLDAHGRHTPFVFELNKPRTDRLTITRKNKTTGKIDNSIQYRQPIDWNDQTTITKLNSWRAQYYRRNVENYARYEPRPAYTEDEKGLLRKYWANEVTKRPDAGQKAHWGDVLAAFKARFPDTTRNESSVSAWCGRDKEIQRLKGKKGKEEGPARGRKRKTEPEEGDVEGAAGRRANLRPMKKARGAHAQGPEAGVEKDEDVQMADA